MAKNINYKFHDVPDAQAGIEELIHSSDEAAQKITGMGSSTRGPRDANVISSEDHEPIMGGSDSEDADGLRDLFQGVDPPDELDVGAASGSSMQEFLVGKSKEILVSRVALGIKFVQRLLVTTKQKVKARFAKGKEWLETPNEPYNVVNSRRLGNGPRLFTIPTESNWRLPTNSLRSVFQRALQSVIRFVHNLIDGVEGDVNDVANGLGEEMDFDVIRKMSGLKV